MSEKWLEMAGHGKIPKLSCQWGGGGGGGGGGYKTYTVLKPLKPSTIKMMAPVILKSFERVCKKISVGEIVFRAIQSGTQTPDSSSRKKSSLHSKVVFTVKRDRSETQTMVRVDQYIF